MFIPVVDFLNLAFESFSFGRNRGVALGSISNFLLELGDGSLCSSLDGVYSISELQFDGSGKVYSHLCEISFGIVALIFQVSEHISLEILSGSEVSVSRILDSS